MKCNHATLLKALSLVKLATDRRSTLPALREIEISASGGRAELFATNLNLEIGARFPVDGDLEAAAVPFAAFDALIKAPGKLKGDIEISERGVVAGLEIKAGSRSFEIDTREIHDRPKRRAQPGSKAAIASFDTDTLVRALSFLIPAVSQDNSRFHICGVHMSGGNFTATNGHVLFQAQNVGAFLCDGADIECLTTAHDAILACAKTLNSPWVMARLWKDQLLEMHFPGAPLDVLLRAKPVEAQFPPVDQVIPKYTHRFRVGRRAFSTSMATVIKVNKANDRSDKGVKLRASGDKLRVTTEAFTESLALTDKLKKSGTWTGWASPNYLNLASAEGDDELVFEFKPGDEELSPVLIRPASDLLAVVMPRKPD